MKVKPNVRQVFDGGWRCWHASNVPGCFRTQREAFDAALREVRRAEVPC